MDRRIDSRLVRRHVWWPDKESVALGLPLEILKGRLKHFYQATPNGARQSKTHIKVFWILIWEYDNSLRATWKRCAKIEPKSRRGQGWIQSSSSYFQKSLKSNISKPALLFLRFFIVVQEINYPSWFIVKQRKKRRISLFRRSHSKPSPSWANSTSLLSRLFVLCRYFREQREKIRWHDRRKFVPSGWDWMVYGFCHKSLKNPLRLVRNTHIVLQTTQSRLWLAIQAANYPGNYWQSYIKRSLSLEIPSFVLVEFRLELFQAWSSSLTCHGARQDFDL